MLSSDGYNNINNIALNTLLSYKRDYIVTYESFKLKIMSFFLVLECGARYFAVAHWMLTMRLLTWIDVMKNPGAPQRFEILNKPLYSQNFDRMLIFFKTSLKVSKKRI